MTTIVGICGSLRQASYNGALLRAAQTLCPEGDVLDICSLHGIPLYDGDLEAAEGIPPAVTALQERIAASDGLLLASPEYNNAMPGVLKNALDWLSRPPQTGRRLFNGKAVAVMGATPGGMGTALAQASWLPVMRALGMQPWFGQALLVSRAGQMFDERGELRDVDTRERLASFMAGFSAFAADRRRPQAGS
jgi:chromate reductase